MGRLHQQPSQVAAAALRYSQLRCTIAGLTLFEPQAKETAHLPTSLEARRVFYGPHIGQRDQGTHALKLSQQSRFQISPVGSFSTCSS